MICVKDLIYCKNEEDLEKAKNKYPFPPFKWDLFNINFPVFLKVDHNEMEVFRISPLKTVQQANVALQHTKDPKRIELYNKLLKIAGQHANIVTQQSCVPSSDAKSLKNGILTPQFLKDRAKEIGLVKDGKIVPEKAREIIAKNNELAER